MKKIILMATVALFALQANAQEALEESNICDNWYVGVNAGIGMKTTENSDVLKNLNPSVGLRLGRYWTPVTGWMISGEVFLRDKAFDWSDAKTVKGTSVDLLGTLNLSNWFGGYLGEPRHFEVVALAGLGWNHVFDTKLARANDMVSKFGLDFTFNLGEKKAWQFYVEPSITWGLNDEVYDGGYPMAYLGHSTMQYNLNKAYVQLNAGFIYKFKNSNGTHNFTVAQLRNQAEIDALNAEINRLRGELAQKPKEIVKEVEVIKEVAGKDVVREVKVEDLVFVTFAQGKSELTADARKALAVIQPGKHVQIVGTASPEGNPELNQKLSQARADAVAQYLLTRGVAVDEATGKGVQGTTSNRLAVVYVK